VAKSAAFPQILPTDLRYFNIFVAAMKNRTKRDSLSCGIPRGVIEAAFWIMIAAAICSWHSVNDWMLAHIPVVLGLVNTVGMVIMYYGFMRGMNPRQCVIIRKKLLSYGDNS
jgi:hypothetical protein